MISGAASPWEHAVAVTRPALLLAPADFLDEIAGRLRAAGVQDALARRESAPLFDFVAALAARQGIANDAAIRFDAQHGGVTWATVEAGLAAGAACPRLALLVLCGLQLPQRRSNLRLAALHARLPAADPPFAEGVAERGRSCAVLLHP